MNVCVYGSSSSSISQLYLQTGYDLGKKIAQRGWGLVFGGGTTGMMGAVVRGVEALHGWSIGISPHFFNEEGVLHIDCSEFIFTETMRERKALMEEKADAFIMVPGGIGTLEEFFEILTLKQLKQHRKPICILNTDGCYNGLNELLHSLVRDGFMSEEHLALYFISDSADAVLEYIASNSSLSKSSLSEK